MYELGYFVLFSFAPYKRIRRVDLRKAENARRAEGSKGALEFFEEDLG